MYNKVEQDFWLKELSQRARVDEIFLREELQKIIKNVKISLANNVRRTDKTDKKELGKIINSWEDKLLESLLSLILKFSNYSEYVFNNLSPDFVSGKYREFYNSCLIYYNRSGNIDYSGLLEYLSLSNPELVETLKRVAIISDFYWPDNLISYERAKEEIVKNLLEVKKNFLKKSIKEENDKLLLLERGGGDVSIVMKRLKELNDELKKIV